MGFSGAPKGAMIYGATVEKEFGLEEFQMELAPLLRGGKLIFGGEQRLDQDICL